MSSSKTYDKYKNVKHELFDQIPSHWELFKASHLFDNIGSGTTPKSDKQEYYENGEVSWLTTGDLNDNNLTSCDGKITRKALEEHTALKEYPEGSIAIAMYGATIGKTAILQFRTTTNQACCVFSASSKIHNKYFHYQLLSLKPYILSLAVGGGQPNINQEVLRSLKITVPKHKEQLFIANFLDSETAKIDSLISEQEKLIELLQEKRQAVISHAVTKGLNPSAPMKDSGVEWLDEVPEHWRVLPVWILFHLGRGRVISHEDIQRDPGDYPIYSSQTENNGEMGKIGTFDFDGDYLTWTTDGANAGTVFKRNGKFNCTNVCGTLKAKYTEQINLDFALLALSLATSSYVRMDINPKLMNNVMASIRIPIPSINEQESIVHFLNNKLSGFEPLEATIDEQVLLLKERRSALISAAVTGQIDVRHLASKEDAA